MPCLSRPVKVETITTGVTYGAEEELMDQVRRKVRLEGTNLNGEYLIVFCPITSRVGADVGAAMENMPLNKKVILVLMHHTRDPDYSTAGRSWSEVYPNIDLEVHVLFHESLSGLLTCSQNTNAVYQMQSYFPQSGTNSLCRGVILGFLTLLVLIVLFSLLLYFLEVKEKSKNGTN